MPRPIDADALAKEALKSLDNNPHSDTKAKVMHWHEHKHFLVMIDQQPTIDAEPVRHGRWVLTEYEYLDCSVCGKAYYTGCESLAVAKKHFENAPLYNFCPNCGAKMDGGAGCGTA